MIQSISCTFVLISSSKNKMISSSPKFFSLMANKTSELEDSFFYKVCWWMNSWEVLVLVNLMELLCQLKVSTCKRVAIVLCYKGEDVIACPGRTVSYRKWRKWAGCLMINQRLVCLRREWCCYWPSAGLSYSVANPCAELSKQKLLPLLWSVLCWFNCLLRQPWWRKMWGEGWESGIVAFDSNELTYRIAHSCLFVWRSRKQQRNLGRLLWEARMMGRKED